MTTHGPARWRWQGANASDSDGNGNADHILWLWIILCPAIAVISVAASGVILNRPKRLTRPIAAERGPGDYPAAGKNNQIPGGQARSLKRTKGFEESWANMGKGGRWYSGTGRSGYSPGRCWH